jgi:glycosyltransferase involved in cell wall biosynthesis
MSADHVHVLQAAAWYPPHNLGGTEIYLEGLVSALAMRGITSTVLVPRHAAAAETYEHARTSVETYPVNETPAKDEFRRGLRHLDFDVFVAQLRAHAGAIYHQHSWTRGCGPHHLRVARELGFSTIVTVHVAGNICLRGTMLRFGEAPCDGRVEAWRCGACWAHNRGLPKSLAGIVSNLPPALAKAARAGGAEKLATALSARALGAERLSSLREMVANADRVIAVCQWLYDALAINGVPRAKLALSRQGISPAFRKEVRAASRKEATGRQLRLLFLGRWHEVKGIDVLVRAVRALPDDVDVRLAVHAVASAAGEQGYEAKVRALAGADPRIAFEPPVPRDRLASLLAENDVLAVPSLCLETGPLVVIEAQAAGLFVLGSRLGGIAELVEASHGGELVAAGEPRAWARAIERLARRHAAGELRRTQRAVRTMDAAAGDMAGLYRALVGQRGDRSCVSL